MHRHVSRFCVLLRCRYTTDVKPYPLDLAQHRTKSVGPDISPACIFQHRTKPVNQCLFQCAHLPWTQHGPGSFLPCEQSQNNCIWVQRCSCGTKVCISDAHLPNQWPQNNSWLLSTSFMSHWSQPYLAVRSIARPDFLRDQHSNRNIGDNPVAHFVHQTLTGRFS